ncbi:MAG: transposase [Methylocella sp.]|jgi:transposase
MGLRSCSTKAATAFPGLELVWADSGYTAHQVNTAVARVPSLHHKIVRRSDGMKGFVPLLRRWVVERTFSWFGRDRHLAKNWENLATTLQAFVALASIQIAIRRLVLWLSFESGSEARVSMSIFDQ